MHSKIALISNEKTILGFEVAGVVSCPEATTVFCFDQDAKKEEVLDAFLSLTGREDVGIVLISENYAELIHDEISKHKRAIPSVLTIPFRL